MARHRMAVFFIACLLSVDSSLGVGIGPWPPPPDATDGASPTPGPTNSSTPYYYYSPPPTSTSEPPTDTPTPTPTVISPPPPTSTPDPPTNTSTPTPTIVLPPPPTSTPDPPTNTSTPIPTIVLPPPPTSTPDPPTNTSTPTPTILLPSPPTSTPAPPIDTPTATPTIILPPPPTSTPKPPTDTPTPTPTDALPPPSITPTPTGAPNNVTTPTRTPAFPPLATLPPLSNAPPFQSPPPATTLPLNPPPLNVTPSPPPKLSTSPTNTPVSPFSPVPSLSPVSSLSPIPTVTVSPKTPVPTLVTRAPVPTPKPTVPLPTSPLTPVPTPSDGTTQPPVVVPTEVPALNVISANTTNTVNVPRLPGEFQPADPSQLLRTVKYLQSIPGSSRFAAGFNSPTPQSFGGVLQVPKAKDFTNDAKVTIPYQLSAATAALCGPTCTALCQIDDGTPEPCGNSNAVSKPGDLSDGYHRVTAAFWPAPDAPAPVGSLSTFFTVDTVSPTISIALEADNTESPNIFIDASTGQQTVFITWATIQPCPGYAVASESVGDLSPDSFNLEGAQIVNFRRDAPAGGARRRALLQATAQGGNSSGTVAYSFEVVPVGFGPQLLRVAVNPGLIFDQAGNPIRVTSESAYVIYYDAVPPSALLQLVNKDPNGVVSLSTDPGVSPDRVVTLVMSFDKRVSGFDATSMIIQNGTLIRAGPNAATADGFSYILSVVIDPNANLVIQAPANSAYSIVGLGNTASNQLQVLNYDVNQRLQTGVRAAAIASLGVVAAGGFFVQASSSLFINVASSLSLFAARQSLNAPLPTPYIDASSALSFSLFRWPSPFDGITRDSPIPYTNRPQALNSGVPSGGTNGTLATTSERLGRLLLQAPPGSGTVVNGTANSGTPNNGIAVPAPPVGTIPSIPVNLTTTNVLIPANTSLLNQARPVIFGEGNILYEASTEMYSEQLSVNTLNLFHTVRQNG